MAPMINKVLESYSKDNSLSNDMSELFNITSNSESGLSDIAGNIRLFVKFGAWRKIGNEI